jgi:hypothetical protein
VKWSRAFGLRFIGTRVVATGFFAVMLDHVLTAPSDTFSHAFGRLFTLAPPGRSNEALGVGLFGRIFAGLVTPDAFGSALL